MFCKTLELESTSLGGSYRCQICLIISRFSLLNTVNLCELFSFRLRTVPTNQEL